MNRIYNLVWSSRSNNWRCVAETVHARGKPSRSGLAAKAGMSSVLMLLGGYASAAPPPVNQLPTQGQVVAGQAQIQVGAPGQMTITQGTNRAAINWQSFSIGSAAKVDFQMPSSQSVSLNRVLGSDPSQIFGSLVSNGQVFLTNPNGVLFAPTASVDVGGLVATTMGISTDDFMAGKSTFSRNGSTAGVVNQGSLTANLRGYIALLAPEVRNEGVIVANAGTVAMAAGEAITLSFDPASHLSSIAVTPSQIQALVENRRAVVAEGGQIILSARAVDQLQASVVNSGTLSATSIVDKGGVISITGDSVDLTDTSHIEANGATDGGSVTVIGTSTVAHGEIQARGGSGNGGQVETSGHTVDFNGLTVDASSAHGTTGNWLVDPYDLTIDSTAASTINNNLATANVTLQTTASGASGPGNQNAAGNGDIFINSALNWSTANTLKLDAYRNITFNASVSAGNTGKVILVTGDTAGTGNSGSATGDYSFASGASMTFGSSASSATLNIGTAGGGAPVAYTLVYALNTTTMGTTAGNLGSSTAGKYALATALTGPSGLTTTGITTFATNSILTGLGNTIDSLTITGTNTGVGLFGTNNGTIRDLGLTNVSIAGYNTIGALVSTNNGTVKNDWSTGTVTMGTGTVVGGLVGTNAGTITGSYSSASVSTTGASSNQVGGLVGATTAGTISNSYTTGTVSGTGYRVGGLLGFMNGGSISNSYATGAVSSSYAGNAYVGGLVGQAYAGTSISGSHATGSVSGTAANSGYVGGLIGEADAPTISTSYATGNVSSGTTGLTGGLIGRITAGSISQSFATGNVTSSGGSLGGLVGQDYQTPIANSYAQGNVTGTSTASAGSQTWVGGLVGDFGAGGAGTTLTDSYAAGAVTVTSAYSAANVGPLVGRNLASTITSSDYDSNVSPPKISPAGTALSGANTFGTAQTTAQLQNGSLPSGFSSPPWGVLSGIYPFLTAIYGASPQIISGTAYTSGGVGAASAAISIYAGGGNLGNAVASSSGYYYVLAPSGTVTSTTPLGATMALSGATSTVVGLSYADTRTLVSGNVTNFNINQYINDCLTTLTTFSALNTAVNAAFGGSTAGNAATSTLVAASNLGVRQIRSTGDFTQDINLGQGGSYVYQSGGNLVIANTIVANNAGNTISLKAAGTITDSGSGALTATNLALLGGNVTLDSTTSNVSTLAASGVGSLSYTNSGNLSIASVPTTSSLSGIIGSTTAAGINASGAITVAATGNLTVNANVATSGAGQSLNLLATGQLSTGNGPLTFTSNGGNVLLTADTDNSNGGNIATGGMLTVNSSGGNITFGGGDTAGSGYAIAATNTGQGGLNFGGALALNSGGGNIALRGKTGSFTMNTGEWLPAINGTSISANSGTGTIAISGVSNTYGYSGFGLGVSTSGALSLSSASTQTNAISLTGTSLSNTTANQYGQNGIYVGGVTTIAATGQGGGINVTAVGIYDSDMSLIGGGTILANSGPILIQGHAGSKLSLGGVAIGAAGGSTSSSDISILGDAIRTGATINTTGNVLVAPISATYPAAFSTAPLTFANTSTTPGTGYASVTIGKSGNTASMTVGSAITSAGPITVYGGAVAVNSALNAANSTVTLAGSGAVTQTAAITAGNLELLGGAVTLTNSGNDAGTLAASGVSSLNYVDSNALGIGTVAANTFGTTAGTGVTTLAAINGINATGTINVATLNGNLNVSQAVATTNATSTAITLNAGQSAAAGTAAGGNITIGGSAAITPGSGGRATLYSGSATDDTSLANLIGWGSGNFRYDSDESAQNFTALLGAGLYGVYRQQLSTSTIAGNQSLTYGTAPVFSSGTGLANGDTATLGFNQAPQLSSSGNVVVGTYAVSGTSASLNALAALGYTVTGSTGSVTINPKALTLSDIQANDKVYDASTAATLVANTGSLSGLVSGDTVLFLNSSATFSDANAASGKTVTVNGISLSGLDAVNYTVASAVTTKASILPELLTLSANKIYNGTTSLAGAVTFSGLVNGETLNYSGATSSDIHVATQNKYISSITLMNGTGLASNYVLPTLNATNAPVTITAAPITATFKGTVSKVYDGTSAAPSNLVQTWRVDGLLPGDAITLNAASLLYNTKDVLTANRMLISGLGIASVSGSYGTAISDYVLTSTTTSVKATITSKLLGLQTTKTYDGTTGLAGDVTLSGLVGSETLGYSGATSSDAHVATTGKYITNLSLTDGSNGGLASNYALPVLNATNAPVTINPAQLTVSLDNTGSVTKVYDGSTSAPADFVPSWSVAGLVPGDAASVATSSTSYNSKDVLTANKLIVSGLNITGVTGSNNSATSDYVLSGTTTSLAASITPAMLTLSASKTYDGSTDLTGALTLGGLVGSETLAYSGAVASDAHVATSGKYVTSVTLADGSNGGMASNYALPALNASTAPVTINAATLTATLDNTGVSKVYDGSADAPADFVADWRLAGLVAGDSATVSGTPATYNSKDVLSANTLTVSGLALSNLSGSHGSQASDYQFDASSASVAATITPRTLTVSATKTYDGSTSLSGAVTLGGLVGSETLSYSNATASDAHVATPGKFVSSLTLADGSQGGIASNYALPALNASNAPVTINAATLVASLDNADGLSKVYDGTTDAPDGFAASWNITGLVPGDHATVGGSAATYNSKDVLTANKLTVSHLALTGISGESNSALSDYLLSTSTASVAATITPKTLGLTATKTYDGTTQLNGAVTLSGLVGSENLGYAGAQASDAHVATAGKYVSAIMLTDGTGGNAGLASNYALPMLDAANAPVTINPATLIASVGNTGVTKVYDGTTDAPADFAPSLNVSGLVAGDTAAALSSTTSAYNSKDVLGATSLTVSGLALNGITGSNHSATSDYVLQAFNATVAASITPKTVTLSASKTYDGSTDLTGALTLGGLVGSETLAYSGAVASDAHVATSGKYVTSVTLADGSNGGMASNYALPALNASTAPVTINAATLTATLDNTGVSKVYDGSADAPADFVADWRLAGLVAGDSATVSGTPATYNSKDVLSANTLTVSGLALSNLSGSHGSQASDYQFDASSASVAATITPRTLTVSATKTYDGSTSLSGAVTLGGLVGSETLSYSNATASDAHVATPGKFVSSLTLADGSQGGIASNYALPALNASNAPVTINAATLVASLDNLDVSKVYDGSTAAPAGFVPSWTVSGLVAGDTATLTQGGASYNSKDVLTANTVTVSGLGIGAITGSHGSVASDYVMANSSASVAGSITPKTLTLQGITAADKTYDGTTAATITNAGNLSGVIGTDQVFAVDGSASFADKNAGVGKTVTLAGIGLSGADAANYSVAATSGTTASITPAALQIASITASDKTYDGTTSAAISTANTRYLGLVAGDQVNVNATGAFSDKNAGNGKTVNLSSSYSGADVDNYLITPQLSTTASITPLSITINGFGGGGGGGGSGGHGSGNDAIFTKTYDGTTTVPIDTSGVTFNGLLPGDQLGISAVGTAADKNVGVNKPITIIDLLTGPDAGNYAVPSLPTTGTVTITPAALAIAGITASNKTYDGTTLAVVDTSSASYAGLVSGDQVSVQATGSFSDRNAGVNKTVNLSSSYSGGDVGNYTITSQASASATITPAALQISTASVSKVYDGNTSASGGAVVVGGTRLATGDSISGGTFTFNDKNVGVGDKAVIVSGVTVADGNGGGNYVVTYVTNTASSITPRALTVTGITAEDKVYDGSLAAPITTAAISYAGLVPGDVVSLASVSGSFANKNVGTDKPVTLTTSFGGVDAGNYLISAPTSSSADITPKTLIVTGLTVADLTFNGSTVATINTSGAQLNGLVGGDQVGVLATGTFASSGVGSNIPVTINEQLTGPDAGNYTINPIGTATGVITAPTAVTPPIVPVTQAPLPTVSAPPTAPGGNTPPAPIDPGAILAANPPGAGDTGPSVDSLTILKSPSEALASGGDFISVQNFEPVTVLTGADLTVHLPMNTFTHSDPNALISYEARLADGSPLPAWLHFDARSLSFSGKAPGKAQTLKVVIIARDRAGHEAHTILTIMVQGTGEEKAK